MVALLVRCLKDESGQEAVEYALVTGLIVVACLGLMSQLGINVSARWQGIFDAMDQP